MRKPWTTLLINVSTPLVFTSNGTNKPLFLPPFMPCWFLASSSVLLVSEVVHERRSRPEAKHNDLMDLMLEGKDPQTGEKLPVDRVRMNVCHPNNPGLLQTKRSITARHFHDCGSRNHCALLFISIYVSSARRSPSLRVPCSLLWSIMPSSIPTCTLAFRAKSILCWRVSQYVLNTSINCPT